MVKKNIKLIIFLLLILSAPFFVSAQEVRHYKIELILNDDNFKLKNIITSKGSVKIMKEKKEFSVVLYSFDNKELVKTYFDREEKNNFILKLPYYNDGKEIKIFNTLDEGKDIFAIDVQFFAKICGDNVCQKHESYNDCPEDCQSGLSDGYCDHQDDGTCDPDCKNIKDADVDCSGENPSVQQRSKEHKESIKTAETIDDIALEQEQKKSFDFKNLFLGFFIIIFLIIFYFFFIKNKKSKKS